MSLGNDELYAEFPGARVEGPRGQEAVDGAIVHDVLKAQGRIWDGEGFARLVYINCSDQKGKHIVRVKGRGWFTATKEQALAAAKRLGQMLSGDKESRAEGSSPVSSEG